MGQTSALLPRTAFGRGFTAALSCRRGGCSLVAATTALARGLLDALHVAGLADQARHLGEAAALDPDVREERIDQRRLHAVAQCRVDHLVGGAAATIAAAAVAVEAVDLEDTDALDLLHRL